eukprot:GGOE01062248.1.p1 GENE.GGOE01062248.1~~GGOE01062248.1.p1  ORF type:complete len:814 (+),score=190.40 GGOE01062248.1:17-2458(+)
MGHSISVEDWPIYFFSMNSTMEMERDMQLDFDWSTPMKLYEENDVDPDPANCNQPDIMDCSPPGSPCQGDDQKPIVGKESPSTATKEKKRKTREEKELEMFEKEKRKKEREEREQQRLVEKAEKERLKKEKEKEREERKRKLEEEKELKEKERVERDREREEKKRKLEEEKELKEKERIEREKEREEKKRKFDEEKDRKEKEKMEKQRQKEKEKQEREELRKEEEKRKEEERQRHEMRQKKMGIAKFMQPVKKEARDENVMERTGEQHGPFPPYEPVAEVTLARLDADGGVAGEIVLTPRQPTPAQGSTIEVGPSEEFFLSGFLTGCQYWDTVDLIAHWRQLAKCRPCSRPAVAGELPPDFNSICKVVHFHDSQRPAYYGTFQKRSTCLTGRWCGDDPPMDPSLDYEVFSEDEWEDEQAEGEEIEDEKEEEAVADDMEDDDMEDFFVDDDYLSADEGLFRSDDEGVPVERNAGEEGAEEADQEGQGAPRPKKLRKRRAKQQSKVDIIGPCWPTEGQVHPLERFRAINLRQLRHKESLKCPLAALISARQVGKHGETEILKQDRTPRKPVQDRHMLDLIRILHGATKLETAIRQFLELHHEECSKAQTEAKMREIATWERAGKFFRWMVKADVLAELAPDLKPKFEDDGADIGSPPPKVDENGTKANASLTETTPITRLLPKSKRDSRIASSSSLATASPSSKDFRPELKCSSPEAKRQCPFPEQCPGSPCPSAGPSGLPTTGLCAIGPVITGTILHGGAEDGLGVQDAGADQQRPSSVHTSGPQPQSGEVAEPHVLIPRRKLDRATVLSTPGN